MFSIHCKVLRVGQQKKEESMLIQNRRKRKNLSLGDSSAESYSLKVQ